MGKKAAELVTPELSSIYREVGVREQKFNHLIKSEEEIPQGLQQPQAKFGQKQISPNIAFDKV